MPKLTLYHYDTCFYCVRVRRALKRLGMTIEERNILLDRRYRDELREATGRSRVPVLRIEHEDGRVEWMPESLDIVAYLERYSEAS
ncbi:MAG: glutaredoxin [Myxococcales bacterium]|jgi:glutaredoxin 2